MRRIFFVFTLAGSLIFGSTTMSIADQTVDIDLNNFFDDGLGQTYSNNTIYDVNDGDIITINVSNSTQGFLGYINNGAGNSLNIDDGGAVNITNNTGQFYGVGTLSSIAYDNTIIGNYTITVTVGANGILSRDVGTEAAVADETADPNGAVGWLVLDWRDGMVNAENWKQLSLIQSVNAASQARILMARSTPILIQRGSTWTCESADFGLPSSLGDSQARALQAVVYNLIIDGQLASRVIGGNAALLPNTLQSTPSSIVGSANTKSASWDLGSKSNFSAQCQVIGWDNGANGSAVSGIMHDTVKVANLEAAAKAWEDQRSAATAANFTKEAREARKRAAARAGN